MTPLDMARDIKEKLTFVAINFDAAMKVKDFCVSLNVILISRCWYLCKLHTFTQTNILYVYTVSNQYTIQFVFSKNGRKRASRIK